MRSTSKCKIDFIETSIQLICFKLTTISNYRQITYRPVADQSAIQTHFYGYWSMVIEANLILAQCNFL